MTVVSKMQDRVKKTFESAMHKRLHQFVFLALLSYCVLVSYEKFFGKEDVSSKILDPSTQPKAQARITGLKEKFWSQDLANAGAYRNEDTSVDRVIRTETNDEMLTEGRGEWVKYTDPNRGIIGSQSEKPWWEVQQDDSVIMVDGYHKFIASRTLEERDFVTLQILKDAGKFETVSAILFDLNIKLRARFGHENRSTSFMDIGCSGGIVSLLAHRYGFDHVIYLDHDAGYIELVHGVVEHLRLQSAITPLVFHFGQELRGNMQNLFIVDRDAQVSLPMVTMDVVYCGAIIHWIFSATASFGNFIDIFEYLFSLSSALVVVEWVAPQDPAILRFGHTSMNTRVQREAYSLANFEAAISHFGGGILERKEIDGPTRILYVIEKPTTMILDEPTATSQSEL